MNRINIQPSKFALHLIGVFSAAVFLLGLGLFFQNKSVLAATNYPPSLEEISANYNEEEKTLTISASGEGGCQSQSNGACMKSEYFDLGVEGTVKRVLSDSEAEDQWTGYAYYPTQTTRWSYPDGFGLRGPQFTDPEYIPNPLDTSLWPSGTYVFCVQVGGSAKALWPEDFYSTTAKCTETFNIVNEPTFTCQIPQITTTLNPGSDGPFVVKSTAWNGFSGNVTYTVQLVKNGSPPINAPTYSFPSDPRPVGETLAGKVITQQGNTTGR